ncbi:Protein SDA1 homolog (Nucleolar protein 130) (SDA1 domain-containing protein 1) (hSDA) [Durusdinium trenchii]|uniref:Protein SDA1 n=1 Tax=Durusdinium trenchii TaxID=1381693 RepID=A0ABP0R8Y4_9DINO
MMLNLALLQNKIKRNAVAYTGEFRQQLRSFDAQLAIFELAPPKDSKEFGRLVTFLSQVSHLYPEDSGSFAGDTLRLLERSYEAMDGDLRKTLFQALVLMRNRGGLDPIVLIKLCFALFRCHDKGLRELMYNHVVSDIRNVNRQATNQKLNKAIQNEVYRMLEDPSSIAAKKSLQIMVDLYKRRVWVDVRTVNVIADACVSNQPKNVAIALQFFLGIDEKIDALEDEEEQDVIEESLEASTGKSREKLERGAQKTAKMFSKKTRSRMRKREKELKALKKARIAKQGGGKVSSEVKRAAAPRFPAIDLLNDPQGFAEKLFKKLRTSHDHFEVRLLMMNLVSRVIGYHKLLVLPFYSFVQKYLQPHQRYVTNVLAYLIQASHDLVPSEDLEPVLKHIANAFVNDRSGPEVMAVGLNSVRELINKVPLLTTGQGMDDLVQDLILYRRFRRDKSVVIAARSLLNLLRELNPAVLQRRERGKYHNSDARVREYGEHIVSQGVDGAELLQFLEEEAKQLAADGSDDGKASQNEEIDEGDAALKSGQQEQDDDDADKAGEAERAEQDDDPAAPAPGETLLQKAKKRKIDQSDRIDAKRLLTDEDFRRIRKLKQKLDQEKRDPRARRKQERKRVVAYQRNVYLKALEKQGLVVEGIEGTESMSQAMEDDDPLASDLSSSSDEESDEEINAAGAINSASLEGVVRRRRRELAERLMSVYEGRKGAHELKEHRTGGTNNAEKLKNKNFLMVSKSRQVQNKQHQSLRQQQFSLKKHIKTLEKSKKTVQKIRRRTKH